MIKITGKNYSPPEDWQALNYFNAYRIVISLLFVTLVWIEQLPEPLGTYDSGIFTIAAHVYFISSILIIFLIKMRLPYLLQLSGHALLDITLITVMMYASNGLNSGFGMLLVITIAGASLLSGRRIAIF
ncbi:MAG: hypothetical protein GWN00_39175, partial [Aliifodinibius sp.]|nr:hypothetical protein [Fodinibius sp.]NIV16602.1 hypothetical protein [Fodinibius sp.]NIY30587.1 hypothetical protein [Fodinibius sp.]